MGEEAMDSRVYGPQTNAVVLNHQEVIELTIHNPNNMPHPLHLHGHAFQIIEYGQADSRFPIPEQFQGVATTRYVNSPVKRDTVSIPEFSYVKMRFCADNPGVWFFHCHLDIHFAMGMAMVFVEAPDVLQETLRVPRSMYEFCHRQDIATAGNAAGNRLLDFSGLQQAPSVVERAVASPTSD
ncbi:ferroxidase fet3 [Coemansia guatemalensis]|uniref:Ferroxidase fet3 n=1 Tax=Coemansia guatemalensis TaxID=2761395 RepID=A0A9W8LUE5_9FUNG|nr:ferroxidase fet3 [Coemansia guatemalensis]